MHKLPVWIEERGGLDFSCTKCGDCCTGSPGYVWLGLHEIERLAELLKVTTDVFGRKYLRRVEGSISLVEKKTGECCFWEHGVGCTVYEARPAQCRTYPFWPEVVRTEAAWDRQRAKCPGMRAGGTRYAPERIGELLNEIGTT